MKRMVTAVCIAMEISTCVLRAAAQRDEAQRARFEAARQRFCDFETAAKGRQVENTLRALSDDDRALLLEMAGSKESRFAFCARGMLVYVREPRVVLVVLRYVSDRANKTEDRRLQCDLIKPVAGKQGLPFMLEVLAEPTTPGEEGRARLRECAIEILGHSDDDLARHRLRALLRDSATGSSELAEVVRSLGELRDGDTVPDLLRLLRGGDRVLASTASRALALIGTSESTAPLYDFLAGMPPGQWPRRSLAGEVMNNLQVAITSTKDSALRAELQQLHARIRDLAFGSK